MQLSEAVLQHISTIRANAIRFLNGFGLKIAHDATIAEIVEKSHDYSIPVDAYQNSKEQFAAIKKLDDFNTQNSDLDAQLAAYRTTTVAPTTRPTKNTTEKPTFTAPECTVISGIKYPATLTVNELQITIPAEVTPPEHSALVVYNYGGEITILRTELKRAKSSGVLKPVASQFIGPFTSNSTDLNITISGNNKIIRKDFSCDTKPAFGKIKKLRGLKETPTLVAYDTGRLSQKADVAAISATNSNSINQAFEVIGMLALAGVVAAPIINFFKAKFGAESSKANSGTIVIAKVNIEDLGLDLLPTTSNKIKPSL